MVGAGSLRASQVSCKRAGREGAQGRGSDRLSSGRAGAAGPAETKRRAGAELKCANETRAGRSETSGGGVARASERASWASNGRTGKQLNQGKRQQGPSFTATFTFGRAPAIKRRRLLLDANWGAREAAKAASERAASEQARRPLSTDGPIWVDSRARASTPRSGGPVFAYQ